MKIFILLIMLCPMASIAQSSSVFREQLPADSFVRIERVAGWAYYPTTRNGAFQIVYGAATRFDSVFLHHYLFYPNPNRLTLEYIAPIKMMEVVRRIASVVMVGSDRRLDLSKKYFFIAESEMQK